jgi:glycine cleavage system H protein
MNPKENKYTKDHEWIRIEPDGKGKIGLADYAQSHLGDLVYFDLPGIGTQVEQSKKLGEVESVKAVADIFAPVSGKVVGVNQVVIDDPPSVNKDCYGESWLLRIELNNPSEMDNLMDIETYEKYVTESDTK